MGAEDTSAPYSVSWNTTTTNNGSHTLTAVARDALGVRWNSDPVTVTVVNPPTITSFTPTSGPVGTSVTVSGTNFTGAMAVWFNGVSASFTVKSATTIQATVPDGATTGPISVTTPGGTVTSSTAFTVTVFNDTTPPTVSITSPPAGATLSDTVLVAADATDDVGVAGVQFLLDGAELGAEDTVEPFEIAWDTTMASDGSHTLTAVARDVADDRTTSSGVSVTVSNGSSEPPPGSTVTRFEETDPAVSFAGSWVTRGEELATFSGGTAVSADASGATVSLTFSGAAVSWLGCPCEVCGIARVLLDGVETTVDTFAPTRDPAPSVVFSATGLPDGNHTLVIEVTETANSSSGGAHIVVDAVDVTS